MAFDFPASPSVGQVYTPASGPSYQWDGIAWMVSGAAFMPAGMIMPFAGSAAPAGWLKCNGAAISRTVYAALFAAIGTTFGAGDGSTTFNLPELRSEFIRGLDDGRGVDAGRALGSAQGDTYLNHAHTGTYADHYHGVQSAVTYSSGPAGLNATGAANAQRTSPARYSGQVEGSLAITVNASTTGGTETRPRNVAMLMCIKT
jgi:microcystin-dependent protein